MNIQLGVCCRKLWLAGCVVILFGGCTTSMKMSPADVATVDPDSGIVFGSILITVAESSWSWNKRFVESREYTFLIEEQYDSVFGMMFAPGTNPHKKKYTVEVKPGQEEYVFLKLPSGSYRVLRMYQGGMQTYSQLVGRFTVSPGETVYIGRLVLVITPASRFPEPNEFSYRFDDAQDQTVATLKKDYAGQLTKITKRLAVPK